jgi:hypothetical protein
MAADDGHWISHDSGRLINPMVVEGQLHGAVALGFGTRCSRRSATTPPASGWTPR